MKRTMFLSAVLSLFLLVPASITSAQVVRTEKGLTHILFTIPPGKITVYLPEDIRAGDLISGSIRLDPAGTNEKQKSKNLAELNRYGMSFSDYRFRLDTGKKFTMHIPQKGSASCRLLLLDSRGESSAEYKFPDLPVPVSASSNNECLVPSHVLTGTVLPISGSFDGNSSNTQCQLDKKDMDILAESPRQCFVTFPADASGKHTIASGERNTGSCTHPISGVDMQIAAGKLNLRKGEKTYINVRLTGLDHLPDTARMVVTNNSEQTITIPSGNYTEVIIAPSMVDSEGVYTRLFDVQSISTGTFSVNVDLKLPPAVAAAAMTNELLIQLNGTDVQVIENGKREEAIAGSPVQVHVKDNSVVIYFNGLYVSGHTWEIPGSRSLQDIMAEFSDPGFQPPAINCDSMTRICRKNAGVEVFWGNVYSLFEGNITTKLLTGEPLEKNNQSSLLITRGWKLNCCNGALELVLSFQSMRESDTNNHSVSFFTRLKSATPCTIVCPECKVNCDNEKKGEK